MSEKPLSIALPTGRMSKQPLELIEKAGLSLPASGHDRKLIVPSEDGTLEYIWAKPTDVPTFVEYGAADLGVCGLDTLRESERKVYEPLLLPFGKCRLSLCGPANRPDTPLRYESQPRVATKYPHLTTMFFRQRGINAEIIKLNGSVELGPLVDLADLIVDLVETGNTLRANGLVEIQTILHSQAVLIANRASYRLKSVAFQRVFGAIKQVLEPQEALAPVPNQPTPELTK